MDWIVIDGLKPYNGRYEFDIADVELTTREWGWIKRFSGYLPLTIEDGFRGADPELYAALACVALRRAGKVDTREVTFVHERLLDAPYGSTIRLESDDDDEVASAPDPLESSREKPNISGTDLMTSSELSTNPRSGFGTPDLDTSESRPTKLAS